MGIPQNTRIAKRGEIRNLYRENEISVARIFS
jgi:hypothetical protein